MKKIIYLSFIILHFSVLITNCLNSLESYQKEPVLGQLNQPSQWLMQQIKPVLIEFRTILPRSLRQYAFIAGINSGYGFFSPNIPSGWAVYFELKKPDGKRQFTKPPYQTRLGKERINTSICWYKDFEKIQPLVAQSWGLRLFEMSQPEVSTVDVISGMYLLPSMEEYRTGTRTRFRERKRFVFKKKA